jgi:hypothetical protein
MSAAAAVGLAAVIGIAVLRRKWTTNIRCILNGSLPSHNITLSLPLFAIFTVFYTISATNIPSSDRRCTWGVHSNGIDSSCRWKFRPLLSVN